MSVPAQPPELGPLPGDDAILESWEDWYATRAGLTDDDHFIGEQKQRSSSQPPMTYRARKLPVIDDMSTTEAARLGHKRATASAFADWVYEQTVKPRGTNPSPDRDPTQQHRLRLGEVTHREIELFLKHQWTREHLGASSESDWQLRYANNQDHPDTVFLASSLTVNEVALRCRPDLVLECPSTKSLIIVERKTTHLPEPMIPTDGWPNVEAQLWCYSWIDEFRDADEVHLIGQLWRRDRGALVLCHRHHPWRRGQNQHERLCTRWFAVYGGCVAA